MRTFASLPILLLAACGSVDGADFPTRAPETEVLFIGNSFTFWHGGLWRQLEALSDGEDQNLGYEADCVVRGGASLEVEVAPVGLAWRLAREARPDLDMYGRDREHPSLAGCYLSLMVIEATISGLPPVAHDPDEVRLPGLERLEVEDARFLQRVAARAVSEWRTGV